MYSKETFTAKSVQKRFAAAVLIAALTILCFFAVTVSFSMLSGPTVAVAMEQAPLSADDAAAYSSDILSWKLSETNSNNLQDLLDGFFCDSALNGNVQTYVTALIDNPTFDCDYSSYSRSLAAAVNEAVASEKGIFPTTLQKAVITICKCESAMGNDSFSLESVLTPEAIDEVLNNTIGTKGIMTYIYGLNMLETFKSGSINITCNYSREDIILTLISMQAPDGGYSLSGDEGDVDVTAMTLRALAGVYTAPEDYTLSSDDVEKIHSSIDASISFLSSTQLDTGDFSSYGNACSESTAQVILAISDLGLDYSEFIKNDHSLLDGLLLYRLPDGSFSHTAFPLASNDMASAQSFEALSAICRTLGVTLGTSTDSLSCTTTNSTSDYPSDSALPELNAPAKTFSIKTVLYIIVAALFAVSVIIFTVSFIRNKNRKRYLMQLISAVLAALVATFAIYSINIASRENYLSAPSTVICDAPGEGIICISYSINCSTIESDAQAADIYHSDALYVTEGATAFDVLAEICRLNDIQIDYESNSVYGTAYIKGINSLYEFDHGDLSGWMYRVNGDFPSVGCGYYTLKEGDNIEWLYTTDIGRDLE